MTPMEAKDNAGRKQLRIWPGVAAVAGQWLIRFVVPVVFPDAVALAVLGGAAGGLAVIVWWLFFSRAPWTERVGWIAMMVAAMVGTSLLAHESIAKGAMGMLLPILAIPVVSLAFVASVAATRGWPDVARRAVIAGSILAASAGWTLVRTGGVTGSFSNDLHWRWSQTPEERLLAHTASLPPAPEAAPAPAPAAPRVEVKAPEEKPVKPARTPVIEETAEWPGFRGPNRDSVVTGVKIGTDWSSSPPEKLWRRPIGPGWSSFAVRGDLFYTQEQRGLEEVVSCYRVTTGEPVWAHRDKARFWESNAGAGPRSTPALGRGRVYTLGATGIVNALDANDGHVVWSRDAAADTGAKVPEWGFSGSPLLFGDVVIAAVGGQLAAFDADSGAPRWSNARNGGSYSSPHFLKTGGVPQVLLLSGGGATSVAPADGRLLWQHKGARSTILQPALTADGDLLVSTTDESGASGTLRLKVTAGAAGWTVEERWRSNGLKAYFNDFVVHKGHAFGFDGSILACIEIQEGKRKWKGGRYGFGQLLLLSDQDLLLVLSEQGELALVKASPDQFTEVARAPAIEGKSWNHPALARDVLLVRNAEEMAAFRIK